MPEKHYTPTGCNHATKPHDGNVYLQCYSMVWTPNQHHRIRANAEAPPTGALGPTDIQDAYNLPDGGAGQTVAIVDAYGYPTAGEDLAVFRSHYGLPACTSDNGCFTKVDQRGGTDYPPPNAGWEMETALDLDAVSSTCPKCHILLVEGDSPSVEDLGQAVETAVELGADFVSNSYGIDGGFPQQQDYDHYYKHKGAAVVVSSGDTGAVESWPSTNPNVTAVGGTSLVEGDSGRGWHETVWGSSSGGDGAGSGCSDSEPKPDYQNPIDTNCDNRATADISAVADPATGLAVYSTITYKGQTGWFQVGGTSLSAPLAAGMYALAGTPSSDTFPVTYPYHDPDQASHLFDVTEGANGGCGNVLCEAGPGWDGPTGLGTPNGVAALRWGPHGDIAGTVTDADTGDPLAGATVSASPGGYETSTDANGHYEFSNILVGDYDVTAEKYRYPATTESDVSVADSQTTTVDFSLHAVPSSTLSGTVTDGSGRGWPLYAKISIDGYPGGPIFTDPDTGHYSVELANQHTYTLHVTALYRGYQTRQLQVHVAASGVEQDITLTIDKAVCIAPGYGWNGSNETFTDWTGTQPVDGWTVSPKKGTSGGWEFDNPGDRTPPFSPPLYATGADDQFAVVDSADAGQHARQDTTLVSPVVDLSGHPSPELIFNTGYFAYGDRSTATAAVSVDGGQTWSTVWRRSSNNGIGHIDIPLPAAANQSQVEIRFHYSGRDAWYWAIDNVFIGTKSCVAKSGGLLIGEVTNKATGDPINGAIVASKADPDEKTWSQATPADANLPGGFYWLFAAGTGEQQFTATRRGFSSATATLPVSANTLTRHDWPLTPSGG